MEYKLTGALNEGVVRLESHQYGTQLWTRGRARKDCRCAGCSKNIAKKSDRFAPITNGYNRMERLCIRCVERLVVGFRATSS